MSYKIFIPLVLSALLATVSCKTIKPYTSVSSDDWVIMATADEVDIFVDTTSIKRNGATIYAVEKRVFLTPESRSLYVEKIKREYTKLGKPEKAEKWNDFSYCLYFSEYECVNNRFRVLWVEDYDSTGKRIVRTSPSKDKINWIDIEEDTVGDYTFFYICDFGN